MNKSIKKLTFCGLIAALCSVIMLLSYVPYLTYSAPAVASVFIMVCFIETGNKYTLYAYIASAVIVFFFAEPTSKILYAVFFGNYPLLKCLYEKPQSHFAEWILKLLSFNISVIIIYLILKVLTGLSFNDFADIGRYGAYIFLLLCNGAFVVFDIALSRLAVFYLNRFHDRISGNFKL